MEVLHENRQKNPPDVNYCYRYVDTPILQLKAQREEKMKSTYSFRFPLCFLMINRMLEPCPLLPDRLTLRNKSL